MPQGKLSHFLHEQRTSHENYQQEFGHATESAQDRTKTHFFIETLEGKPAVVHHRDVLAISVDKRRDLRQPKGCTFPIRFII